MNRIRMTLTLAILASASASLGAQTDTIPTKGPTCPCDEKMIKVVDSALAHMKTPRLASLEASRAQMTKQIDELSKRLALQINVSGGAGDTATQRELARLRTDYEKINTELVRVVQDTKDQTNRLYEYNKSMNTSSPRWSTKKKVIIGTTAVVAGFVIYSIGHSHGWWNAHEGDIKIYNPICVNSVCR